MPDEVTGSSPEEMGLTPEDMKIEKPETNAEKGQKEDELQKSSMEKEIENMPTDDPEAYFDWLKKFHGSEYVNQLLEAGEPAPHEYVYGDDISVEDVGKAVEALKEQNKDDPESLQSFLVDLNPAQITALVQDPTERFYTTEGLVKAMKERIESEVSRLSNYPDFREVASTDPENVRYFHATSLESVELIMQTGLRVPESGLESVAVYLSHEDPEENMRLLVEPHRDLPNEVIVSLPYPSEKLFEAMRGVTNNIELAYIEQLENPADNYEYYTHYIPPEFIEGYFDIIKGEFVKNAKYWQAVLDSEAKGKGWSDEEYRQARQQKLVLFYGCCGMKLVCRLILKNIMA